MYSTMPVKMHQAFYKFSVSGRLLDKAQQCYAKIESIGKGLNIRYIISKYRRLQMQLEFSS